LIKTRTIHLDIERALDLFLTLAHDMIEARTRDGIDKDGNGFQPYSEKYAERRRRAGRNDSGDYLQLSGKMLDNMGNVDELRTSGTEQGSAVLGFTGSRPGSRIALGASARKRYDKTRGGETAYGGKIKGTKYERKKFKNVKTAYGKMQVENQDLVVKEDGPEIDNAFLAKCNQRLRQFFGLTPYERAAILTEVKNLIREEMKA
jgi:hypothetical protein